MVASFGQASMAMYGASRAALELLTKAWAAEYGPQGVRVNAVTSPGLGQRLALGHCAGNGSLPRTRARAACPPRTECGEADLSPS
jgi:NAD(P)-dependent dehydrogenase (short-subunit alcohol dehydrogenase family)